MFNYTEVDLEKLGAEDLKILFALQRKAQKNVAQNNIDKTETAYGMSAKFKPSNSLLANGILSDEFIADVKSSIVAQLIDSGYPPKNVNITLERKGNEYQLEIGNDAINNTTSPAQTDLLSQRYNDFMERLKSQNQYASFNASHESKPNKAIFKARQIEDIVDSLNAVLNPLNQIDRKKYLGQARYGVAG